MENLTRYQVILLVLLVSFVTSLATGVVTVTLVNQAPQPITNTIGKVIEKTIEKVVPGENQSASAVQPVQPPAPASSEENIVNIVQNYSSAVVSVVASKDVPVIEKYYVNPFEGMPEFQIPQYRQKGTEKMQVSSGSGFFVSGDGLVITNKHVVADIEAEYTVIMNDGRKIGAKILARDPLQDIAILKVDGDKYNFIPLGDSDKLKIGQSVIAIGNALGEFQNTVSKGIISGLHRDVIASGGLAGTEELQELIQTDAAINQGNSGGPLLDLSGRVIGINTAMAQGAENVGFALPINIAKRDIEDARQYGEIKYPYFGIRYQAMTSAIKEEKKLSFDYGLVLVKGPAGEPAILKNSPAEKAGLKEGDIIMEYNGTKILKAGAFAFLLSSSRIGDKINLKIWRDGKEMNVNIILEERPENL